MQREGTSGLSLSLQCKNLSYLFLLKHPIPTGMWFHFWPKAAWDVGSHLAGGE